MHLSISIRTKIFIFMVFVVTVVTALGGALYYLTERSGKIEVADRELEADLAEVSRDIDFFTEKGKGDLTMAVNNPVFKEYFSLKDSIENSFDDGGVLEFSSEQRELKKEIEDWMIVFQERFNISEMCLIDKSGHEHAKIIKMKAVGDAELEPDESDQPFFEPGFAQNKNEVNISVPYISDDTQQWVVSFSTPVVLDNGSKPAILHFEVSLGEIQNVMNSVAMTSHERFGHGSDINLHNDHFFIMTNSNGEILANSKDPVNYSADENESEEKHMAHSSEFKLVSQLGESDVFKTIEDDLKVNDNGTSAHIIEGNDIHFVHKTLGINDWKVGIIISNKELLGLSVRQQVINTAIMLLVTLLIIGIVVFLATNNIMQPIKDMTKVANDISQGKLDTKMQATERKDELGELARAFDRIVVSLKLAMREQLGEKMDDSKKSKDEIETKKPV